jgi:hypothetical protein
MKSLLVGIGRYLCNVYNYHDSRACSYKRSGILSRLYGLGVEWFWLSCVIYRIPLWITLCGIFLIQPNLGSLSLQL